MLSKETDDGSTLKTESVYDCSICHGVGFVHHLIQPENGPAKVDYSKAYPCKCQGETWRSERQARLLQYCELPEKAKTMTFETWKQRAGTGDAYKSSLLMADNKNRSWLSLGGVSGTGKTHLALAITQRWLEQGRVAKYIYLPILLDELRDGYQKEGEESYATRFKQFCEVPLLIMDDLGLESQTEWVNEKLTTILDQRLMKELPLVVTTNCSTEDMPYRIASRLKRGGKIIYINASPYQG